MTITFNRGLLLAKAETTFNVPATLDPALDAFEVINPTPAPDITSQLREVATSDLSPFESLITRRIGRINFGMEFKSNGVLPAGTTAPRLGRLLRACAFSETQMTTPAQQLFKTFAAVANSGTLTFSCATLYALRIFLKLKVEIVTGGGTGVAVAAITAPTEATFTTGGHAGVDMTDSNAVVLTNSTPVIVYDVDGNEVCRFTPSFSGGNPATGDVFWLYYQPAGYLYLPISDDIPSLTMSMLLPDDSGRSLRHTITGARGTFTINSQVGSFPTINFEFSGTMVETDDADNATGTYENTLPAQVQFAALGIAAPDARKFTEVCTNSWALTMANTVTPKDCMNSEGATRGSAIVGRAPTLSYDPEAILTDVEPFWNYLENGRAVEWYARHGYEAGNTIALFAPRSTITGISYADRNSIRVFNIDGSLARENGNDEIRLVAC